MSKTVHKGVWRGSVRVFRYALPYRWKMLGVLLAMILVSVATFSTYVLVEPLLDNHLGRRNDIISSAELEVIPKQGEPFKLSKVLTRDLSAFERFVQRHPRLMTIFMSTSELAPMTRVAISEMPISATSVEIQVHKESRLGGASKWQALGQVRPDMLNNVASIRRVEAETTIAPVWVYVILIPGLFLLKGFFSIIRQVLLAWVALNVVRDIQNDLYSAMLRQSVLFFHKARTGDLMSRMVNDVMILSGQIVNVVVDLVQQPIIVVSAVSICLWRDWQLSLTFFLVVPVLAVPMQIMSRRIRNASRKAQEKRADISSVLVETLSGIEVVKSFNMEEYEKERYAAETMALMRREMRIRETRAFSSPCTEMAAAFGVVAVVLIAMWRMQNDPSFQLGKMAFFIICFVEMIKPIDKFWKARFQLGEMAEAGLRIFSVMDHPPSLVDRKDAVELGSHWSAIHLDHVHFGYGKETVLHDIDLHVKRGQKIAIVGKTGSGKTTLVHLIARFFDPCQGAIKFDGVDLRNIQISSLLQQIGIVTQRNILFHDTIANNIAYGRPDITREDIVAAAQAAYADEFIRDLPEGYDTMVGERGVTLSGGQAQRISIARAILKNPPILILDEATASLDTSSEQKVQAALDSLMANRTTFAIAHRLSTILNADTIVVLHEGRIVESGSHDELYRQGGVYRQLYDAQFTSGEAL